MSLETSLFGIAVLLLLGVVLRAVVRPLQWFFVPAAIIGGVIGLGVMQFGLRVDGVGLGNAFEELRATWSTWPGWLIAVVFAGLLLDRPPKRAGAVQAGHVLRAGMMVWIIVVGQIAVGFAAIWWMTSSGQDVPLALGQMIEAGFAGGHGTAGALGEIHEQMGRPDMREYGFFMATIGLLFSVFSGVIYVNIAIRLRLTHAQTLHMTPTSGLERRHDPPPAARATIAGDVIDPLVWGLVLITMAFLIGVLLREQWVNLLSLVTPEDAARGNVLVKLQSLPAFLFTLIGGGIVRAVMQACGVADLIDPQSIRRIVGMSMEVLIVAAVASLRIDIIEANLEPLLVLCAVGAVWCAVCLFLLAPLILPRAYWFELGIINYGMSTGTTAQGLMLARMIDPELDQGAAETYALAAPLSAPFIGGGVITVLLPLWLDSTSAMTVTIAATSTVIGVFITAVIIRSRSAKAVR